jgi:hypothetical protein
MSSICDPTVYDSSNFGQSPDLQLTDFYFSGPEVKASSFWKADIPAIAGGRRRATARTASLLKRNFDEVG